MTTKRARKTVKEKAVRPRMEMRFANDQHRQLVVEAAKQKGLSMNAWIVMVTLEAARREIAKGD